MAVILTAVNVVCCVLSDREINTLRAEVEHTKHFEKSAVYLSNFLTESVLPWLYAYVQFKKKIFNIQKLKNTKDWW